MAKIYTFLIGLAVVAVFTKTTNSLPALEEDSEGDGSTNERWKRGVGGKVGGKVFKEVLGEGLEQGMKQGVKVVVKEGLEAGIKHSIGTGMKMGLKGAASGARKGLAIAGKKMASTKAVKMITTGAIKVGKSKVVKSGKKLVIQLGQEVVERAVDTLGQVAVEQAITALTTSSPEERTIDLYEYLDAADICFCDSANECSCCAEIGDYPKACFNVHIKKTLWDTDTKLGITVTMGADTLMKVRVPVDKLAEKCKKVTLKDGSKPEFCVTSRRLDTVNNVQVKCFDLEMYNKVLKKCFAQAEDDLPYAYYPE